MTLFKTYHTLQITIKFFYAVLAKTQLFLSFIKAKPPVNRVNSGMRQHRILEQGVWYEIRTVINNREPLFRRRDVLALFGEVFGETEKLFAFEVRGLRLEHDLLTFYIKPVDGFQLPDIMKWMKQTLAARYNARTGRIGHVWGDRYWSRILDGEPPEWAEVCRDGAAGAIEKAMEDADDPMGCGQGARTDPMRQNGLEIHVCLQELPAARPRQRRKQS
jgi:REP element-mobilizing transposase RayT